MSYFLKIPEDNKYEEKMQRKKLVLADRGRKIFDPILSQQAVRHHCRKCLKGLVKKSTVFPVFNPLNHEQISDAV